MIGADILPRYWRGWRLEYLPHPVPPAGQYQAWRYGRRVTAGTRDALAAKIEERERIAHAPA